MAFASGAACIWLAGLRWLWYHRPRTPQGFPLCPKAIEEEDAVVTAFAQSLNLPSEIAEKIVHKRSAEHSDIEFWIFRKCCAVLYFFHKEGVGLTCPTALLRPQE